MNHDFKGYTEEQLSVLPKYGSYKQEILTHLEMKKYEMVMTKAKEYMTTNRVKSISANGFELGMKYDIPEEDTIKLRHILSLVLYCDMTSYCTKFSATFRAITGTETMEETKARNAEFYYQSKCFREAVEIFGTVALFAEEDDTYSKKEKTLEERNQALIGPFYTGLNAVFAVPEFCLRLAAPTSTSKQIEVSLPQKQE